jgi:hypothetical protein
MTDTVKIDEKALERAARALCRIDFGRCRGTKRKDVENYVDEEWFEHEEDARAAITAYLTAREEAGFVEVPVEPTEAMHNAFHDCAVNTYNHKNLSYAFALHAYRAMLAAKDAD